MISIIFEFLFASIFHSYLAPIFYPLLTLSFNPTFTLKYTLDLTSLFDLWFDPLYLILSKSPLFDPFYLTPNLTSLFDLEIIMWFKDGGGWVEFNRVNGALAMSRALGDFFFKQNLDAPLHKQIVTGKNFKNTGFSVYIRF